MNIYYNKYINFLIKHNIYNEEIIDYMRRNCIKFDYRDEEQRDFIGCFYNLDRNNRITKINLCVPFLDSDTTVLINIHEYIHLFILYQYLNKKYQQSKDEEILPILYELLYFLDNPSKELERKIIELNNTIKDTSPVQYRIALKSRDELLEYYQKENPSFKKLQEKAKKLSKKYQRDNT